MSINSNEEVIEGVKLHQTVQGRPWWVARLGRAGFVTTPGVKYLTYTLCPAIVGAWHTKTLAHCHPKPKKTFAVA